MSGILLRLDRAILAVCQKLYRGGEKTYDWWSMKEDLLAYHLCYGILASNVSHESAEAATETLAANRLISRARQGPWNASLRRSIELSLRSVGRSKTAYRFPAIRADFIVDTFRAIYQDSGAIKILLERCHSGTEARELLVRIAKGIGPKQASLFLRRIGFCSHLAVLDVHVLRYLELRGYLGPHEPTVSRLSVYERIERLFLQDVDRFGFPPGVVDMAVWVTMRVAAKESLI